MKYDNKILDTIKVIFLALMLTVGIQYVSAQSWTAPTNTPPNGNTYAPLNISNLGQVKDAGLTLGFGLGAPSVTPALIIPYGLVSIGDTTDPYEPAEKIDVVGNVKATGFCLRDGSSCITSWPAGGGGGLPTGTASQTLRHNGTTWLANSIISNDGANVGIGTTGGTHKLNVAGSVNVTGTNSCYRINGACIGNVSGAGTANYVPKWSSASATLVDSRIIDRGVHPGGSQTGGVGINMTNPRAPLHVGPDDVGSGLLRVSKSATSSGNSALQLYKDGTPWTGWAFVNNPQDDLEINYDGSENSRTNTPFFIKAGVPSPNSTNGYVGVGTTNPLRKLHVADGSIYLDGAGKNIIMKSLGGICYAITVSEDGVLNSLRVTCPQ